MTAIAWAIWCAAVLWDWNQSKPDRALHAGDHITMIMFLVGTGMLIWKTVSP